MYEQTIDRLMCCVMFFWRILAYGLRIWWYCRYVWPFRPSGILKWIQDDTLPYICHAECVSAFMFLSFTLPSSTSTSAWCSYFIPTLTIIFLIEVGTGPDIGYYISLVIGTGPDSDYYIFDGNHTISPDVIPAKAGIYVEGGGVDSKSCLMYAHFDRAGELKF